MSQELKVHTRQQDGITLLDLNGDVTMFAETELTRAYRAVVEGGATALALNFQNTDYINSAGIAIIISLLTEARAAGVALVIAGLNPHYHKIFRMVGLTQYADIYDTEAAAVDALAIRSGAI
jgi:anti-anti-sigma factor